MDLIKCNKIYFSYETQAENLLENISFEISDKDKIGLIGKNGSGKTTILKLFSKAILPDRGEIFFRKNIRIGLLPQELKFAQHITIEEYLWQTKSNLAKLKKIIDNPDKIPNDKIVNIFAEYEEKGGYHFEIELEKQLDKFDLNFPHKPIKNLSGGEKTKLGLCKIILSKPTLLLLDEPTNHLDMKSLSWLENYLAALSIPFLVISHDRKFLDNCVNQIWEIENKQLKIYSGNYSFYKKEKENDFKRRLHQFETQKKKIKKLKATLNQRKGWALKHQAQTGKEGYAPVYEMVTNFAKSAMKRAKNIETRIQKEIKKEESQKPFIEKKRKIHLTDSHLNTKFILKVENLSKSFGTKTLFKNLSFSVSNNERLAITGDNGAGKTTLLKILTGKIKDYQGQFFWNPQVNIGYYSQEFENINFEKTIIDELTNGDKSLQTKARTILGSLNIRNDKVFDKILHLSIGERSKVALTKILMGKHNVLVLDEPTNHLEISAREALEEALLDFKGAIIFVTHDRYLQEKLAQNKLEL